MFLSHEFIKPNAIEKRLYQDNIAKNCLNQSTLVVLPTGMGKTIIALIVIAEKVREGKILFLAPTKPLVEQHFSFLKENLLIEEITLFTGEVSPKKRRELWEENKVIVSTPQVIENDLIQGKINFNNISLIVFDEAHRGVGNYSYVFLAERYNGLSLGMTASPGSEISHILEVCNNLKIKNVEIRSEYDYDVRPYVHEIKLIWERVNVPTNLGEIIKLLKAILKEKLEHLKSFGLVRKTENLAVKELLAVPKTIQGRLRQGRSSSLYSAMSFYSQAMTINHAIELAETQGTNALQNYFERLETKAKSKGSTKSARTLINDFRIKKIIDLINKLELEHPKVDKVKEIVARQFEENENSRIIVFTQYRDTAELITNELNKIYGVKSVKFLGQATRGENDKGLTQKEQVEIISKFKNGEYNVLVATAVAEEGLDIPSTELVVFYEPIPSGIRTIQRRGRTGRKKAGKVVILITSKTRDEAYYWSSRKKEREMREHLRKMRRDLAEKVRVSEVEIVEEDIEKEEAIEEMPEDIKELVEELSKEEEKELGIFEERKEVKGILKDKYKDNIGEAKEIEKEKSEEISKKEFEKEDKKEISDIGKKEIIKSKEEISALKKGISKKIEEEKSMEKFSETGKQQIAKRGQIKLFDYKDEIKEEKPKIIVDVREFNSNVVRELARKEIAIEPKTLEIGDYILSDRVCVERKEVSDFLQSIIDNRLFVQIKGVKNSYQRAILIIEGEELFSARQISREAIYGTLATIISDFGIPIIFTKDAKETAEILFAILKREFSEGRTSAVRGEKSVMTKEEKLQFIVEGLPNVSGILAQRLLNHFGTIQNIANAEIEQLKEVKGIGDKIAEDIYRIVREKWMKRE